MPPALLSVVLLASTNRFMSEFFRYGALGLVLLSAVDASFVPLPIPGSADLMLALLAAQKKEWVFLTLASTIGSVVGGAACFYVGQLGGVTMVEKHVPKRYFKRVTDWVENHAFAAVAIPAILPPPFPLIPFVLAAGALKMPKRKFFFAFTLSRMVRHAIFAWLGVHYAQHLSRVWNLFQSRWAVIALSVFWVVVIIMVAVGIVRLVKTQRSGNKQRAAAAV